MQPSLTLSSRVKTGLSVLVPAILIAVLSVYVLFYQPKAYERPSVLLGKPLAAYDDLYPIRANEAGTLYLDKERFEKAIEFFSMSPSPRAIADLIYLGHRNHVTLMLSDQAKSRFSHLASMPEYAVVADAEGEKDKLFEVYKDIVNGIGQTFAGTPIEIVLHDTRNPLKSIVAVQNPISGRRLGDTNTNFGIQLIKNYSVTGSRGAGQSFVSYGLTLKDGRDVKSTTVPIFHDTFGLIGFICINIDISRLDGKDPAAVQHFIEAFRAVTENEAITEMIQNSRTRS